MENLHHRPKKAMRVGTQAFYPCPPATMVHVSRGDDSSSDEDEPFGFIDTLVRNLN